MPAESPHNGKRTYSKHGLTTLKKAVRVLGGRAIDKRTAIGRALEDWRHSLLDDLGGIEHTSTQQRQLVDIAVKTKLLLDSVDAWVLQQSSLVVYRKRALLPVVLQRQSMAESLARLMTQLGLEKRAKPMQSLDEYVKQRYGNHASVPPDETDTSNVVSHKVIAMSGAHDTETVLDTAKLLGARHTLHKPFSMEALLKTVQYELAH
jgi:hypothetical protein